MMDTLCTHEHVVYVGPNHLVKLRITQSYSQFSCPCFAYIL